MRIALIGDGNSVHIRRWASWFRDRGHVVMMASLTPLDNPTLYDKHVYIDKKAGALKHLRAIMQIRWVVSDWKPDIVHGHYLTSGGFAAAISGCRHKVVSAWGSDVYKDAKSRLKGMAIRYAIEHSNVCLGDSDHIVNEVRKMCPNADARKIIFGIDTELFKPNPIPHDKFRFLSIRATTPTYNPLILLQAFELAKIDAELWMYKPSAECQFVMDYVESNIELSQRVVWIDTRSYDKMPRLYNSVDVGISIPSWDSSSTAMNECMACGVPVIASDIPQNHEWIKDAHTWEDGNGFLSKIEPHRLAHAMIQAHSSQSIKDGQGQRGFYARKKIVADADWNTEMLKAEEIYNEVIG